MNFIIVKKLTKKKKCFFSLKNFTNFMKSIKFKPNLFRKKLNSFLYLTNVKILTSDLKCRTVRSHRVCGAT